MTTRRLASTAALPALLALTLLATGCASGHRYHDAKMDFGVVKTVAVLPMVNLTRENAASERVRDVFSNLLLSTGSVYVLPQGEVQRALGRSGLVNPAAPSVEEVVKLGQALSADAVITGVVREYGEIRSGSSAANVISLSLQMHETGTGRVVWSASTTKGGIGFGERLLGGGGVPMNQITEAAANELIRKLFQ